MEQQRIGSSINHLPYFDGNNYPQWKAHIELFLKMKGEQVWNLDGGHH